MAYKQKPMTFGEGTDLTKTPNPTTKAVHRKFDTDDEMTDADMENKGDFNISNLHKDTKISLDKKKKKLAADKASNKKRSDAERALEAKEDAEGK
tara:strand:+ start:260 stop:544 length:285 start_codon:yes stop_codon:yes gene_type:complete